MFVFCLILNRENKRGYSSFFLFLFFFHFKVATSVLMDNGETYCGVFCCLVDKAAFERWWFDSFDTAHFYNVLMLCDKCSDS